LKANRRYREDNRESDASSNDDDEIRPNGPIESIALAEMCPYIVDILNRRSLHDCHYLDRHDTSCIELETSAMR
jgi:hypothetical protein